MKRSSDHPTRRTVIRGAVLCGAFVLAGCSPAETEQSSGERQPKAAPPATDTPRTASMIVYRDPSCGCCETWAELARNAGYEVRLVDDPDMPAVKQKYGVPKALSSCHTAIVGGYAVEGHVPLEDVKRLLRDRPEAVRGIAVPGMPRGSPGMEVPDGARDPFQVIAFDGSGKTFAFRT